MIQYGIQCSTEVQIYKPQINMGSHRKITKHKYGKELNMSITDQIIKLSSKQYTLYSLIQCYLLKYLHKRKSFSGGFIIIFVELLRIIRIDSQAARAGTETTAS